MIRLSVSSDFEGIIRLWQEAFGDTEEAIRMFLHSRYIPENTIVAEENGAVVSMLFLLDGKFKVDNILYNSYYLYAAATAKAYRGRGIMAELLGYAQNLAESRKIDFICLKPAEESLYGFYEKFGYKSVFAAKRVSLKCGNDSKIYSDSDIDWEKVRNEFLIGTDAFIWDNQAIEFAVNQHIFYGGNVLKSCKGYCLYTYEDSKCYVKELCFTHNTPEGFFLVLKSKFDFEEIIIELPVGYADDSDGELINNGMALAVSSSAQNFINNIKNAYLNLTLD